jgi:hypothetical protein
VAPAPPSLGLPGHTVRVSTVHKDLGVACADGCLCRAVTTIEEASHLSGTCHRPVTSGKGTRSHWAHLSVVGNFTHILEVQGVDVQKSVVELGGLN